jgi:serine/threonine protein kinase
MMKFCPKCLKTYDKTQRFCLEDGGLLSLKDPYHLVGTTLVEKYRLDALVGVGGMGAVYSALHLGIERRVAVKVLLPHLSLNNQRILGLFEREAKIAGRLTHENIADVKDAGQTPDGIAYLVMEWLGGSTLEDELAARGPLSLERTADLLRQTASALDEAHSKHVIHRDLKPSNVMLIRLQDGREQVKVLDFGIGKVLSDTSASPVSGVMGTPQYASPEQFNLGWNIDGRTDIYSLGIMLYQMLTGALPFDAPSIREVINMHLTAPPPPLRQSRPDAPQAIEDLITRMLSKNPEQRPQRAGEVSALFERGMRGEPARLQTPVPPTSRPAPPVTPIPVPASPATEIHSTQAPPIERKSRAGLYLALAGVALIGVIGFLLLLYVLKNNYDSAEETARLASPTASPVVGTPTPRPSLSPLPTATPKIELPASNSSDAKQLTVIADKWVVYSNETVVDLRTKLMWTKKDYRVLEGRFVKGWDEAMAWAEKMNAREYAGYKDWRVPSISEYKSIIDRENYPNAFESQGEECYWSRNEINQFVASYIYMRGPNMRAAVSGAKNEGAGTGALFEGPFSVRLVRDMAQ